MSRLDVGATGTLRTVARIWQDLLGVPEVGPEDNFFALGGRSLVAMKVVAQVCAQVGVEIRLADVFRAPVLRSFAELVDARMTEGER